MKYWFFMKLLRLIGKHGRWQLTTEAFSTLEAVQWGPFVWICRPPYNIIQLHVEFALDENSGDMEVMYAQLEREGTRSF